MTGDEAELESGKQRRKGSKRQVGRRDKGAGNTSESRFNLIKP